MLPTALLAQRAIKVTRELQGKLDPQVQQVHKVFEAKLVPQVQQAHKEKEDLRVLPEQLALLARLVPLVQ
jgi:hypothetical protein